MTRRDLNQSISSGLGKLMSLSGSNAGAWSNEDLASILSHQLRVPLAVDLTQVDAPEPARRELAARIARNPDETFAAVLFSPNPPLEILSTIKDFAKLLRSGPDAPIPAEVATMIYYAAIAAALAQKNHRLSELGDAELRKGLDWARGRKWIDATMRELLDTACARLEPKTGP